MSKLKPCPFCGGEAVLKLVEVDEPFTFTDLYYDVFCKKCGCSSGLKAHIPKLPQFCKEQTHEAQTKVIEAWNRRAEDG